ncbi:MAG TPA: glycosyltransferase, partial [Candidatus Eisenbacteria bacterium]|nr:glycosyltransferase [Candidatus Eisenbacteria bacterium]
MHISVIVPTLNEEIPLARTLEAAGAERRGGWIVADRGSEDWTRELAAGAGTRVTMSRQAPLVSGARAADGDVLLFLRAGDVLPDRARARVRRAVQGGADGGALG